MKKLGLFILSVLLLFHSCSQAREHWEIQYELANTALPALHSFAWAQLGDDLLVIGGRKDGLHPRQPSLAFDEENQNDSMWVLGQDGQLYAASLQGLSDSVRAQLSSTNPQFVQRGKYLYFTGGYGYFPPMDEHITYDALLVLDVSKIIESIQKENKINPRHIQVFRSDTFAVTGGIMELFEGHLLLAGGHRFDGFYNPVDNPTFTQVYHEKILEFDVNPEKGTWKTIHLLEDSLLHRRDYNSRVIKENGKDKLILFSGVFRKDRNMPYTHVLSYSDKKLVENKNFNQCFSNYHTAHAYLDDNFSVPEYRNMEIFFGGLAGYYIESDTLVYDGDIPFTSHTSLLRLSDGPIQEYLGSQDLPGFLGTAAVFVSGMKPNLETSKNEIYLGTIIGGITTDQRNVFWSAKDKPSQAHSQLIHVYLRQSADPGLHKMAISESPYQVMIYPDSDYTYFTLEWNQENERLLVEFFTMDGSKLFGQYILTDKTIHQKLKLPEELMKHNSFMMHLKGSEEYWIRVMNND